MDKMNDSYDCLSEHFGIAPFSVLNARDGWWQNRKKAWISIGIQSEIGREDNLCFNNQDFLRKNKEINMLCTSIFDPVLCELVYRWFCPPNGKVIDPFAGGSVRGIVASRLGRFYTGIDLRFEQVQANIKQATQICTSYIPSWINSDSNNIIDLVNDRYDFILSCPPYVDLERYSDLPQDLSTMNYNDFIKAYFDIIQKTCSLLNNDSFAVFVVGEVRDKKGNYYNFVSDTIKAFRQAGLFYYNEMILVTNVGSLPLRAKRQFVSSRKIGKTHQNILVFVKGDAKKASQKIGDCDFKEDIFDNNETETIE